MTTYHAQLSYRHPDTTGVVGCTSVSYTGLTSPPFARAEDGLVHIIIGSDQFIFTVHTFIGIQFEEEQDDTGTK